MTYTLEEITSFIFRPINILDYAYHSLDVMDDVFFITGNNYGYNASHLKFNLEITGFDLINNVDVDNINEALKIADDIFNEKSSDRCVGDEEDFKGYIHYKAKDINIAVMITRFKNSNHWLEFFMEGKETELALHNDYNMCISHLLQYFLGGEC